MQHSVRFACFLSILITVGIAAPVWAQQCAPIVADIDHDGDVDLVDHTELIDCLTGPGQVIGGTCNIADLYDDGRVDLRDHATLQRGFTGSACGALMQPYLTTTLDFGHSYVPYVGNPPTESFLGRGLAALDDTGTLVMHADNKIQVSRDDGCNWGALGAFALGFYRVEAGPDGYAYAWREGGPGTPIHQVRDTLHGAAPWEYQSYFGPVDPLIGFGVNPNDPLHVRTAGNSGQLYQAFDGGQFWQQIGVAPGVNSLGYFIKFDPHDFDHVIYGRATTGAFVTFDAGQTWTQATGLSESGTGSVNCFNAVFSGPNSEVIYAAAIDIEQSIDGHPTGGRHIYASTDGGLSFAPVLDNNFDGVFLQNSPEMLGDPEYANILRFVFSVSPAFGGTTFYTYDLSGPTLDIHHDPSLGTVRGMYRSRTTRCAIHLTLERFFE